MCLMTVVVDDKPQKLINMPRKKCHPPFPQRLMKNVEALHEKQKLILKEKNGKKRDSSDTYAQAKVSSLSTKTNEESCGWQIRRLMKIKKVETPKEKEELILKEKSKEEDT